MAGSYRQLKGRWGTYSRISDDPNDTQRGVARQRQDTRGAVESRGAEVAKEYVENDTSAYRKKRIERRDEEGNTYWVYRTVRPVWQRALADLRSGVIDGLMVYDLDRLARDPRDLEDAIELVEHYGRRIEGEQGSLDLTTDNGRAMARVLMAMANKSSADTGRRVKRAALEAAREGTPAGKRAFGWADNKIDLHPIESVLARAAIADVISGARTLGAIANDWNKQGAFTAHYETPWSSGKVRQYLSNPRLAGWRTYRREIALDKDGKKVRGIWEPLVDDEQWELLQNALTPRQLKMRQPRKNARHYLLTGLLYCSRCMGLMYGNYDQRRDLHYYRCINVRHGESKHTLTIVGPETDELIVELITRRLATLEPVVVSDDEFADAAELAGYERKIRELMTAYNADQLPGAVAFPQVKDLEDKAAPLRIAEAAWRAAQDVPQIRELTDMFATEDPGVRRTVAETLIERVIVRSVRTRSRSFDPDRIDVWWKEESAQEAG